ncbi:MAG TPA: OmpA family protein [Candidatus Sulfotelmatobacter sp.]|nr:OmpA family protein [Candidatus Sulfotelmatobacter sp.]
MKAKWIYSLALAAGVVAVTAGCKHEVVGVRSIPPGAWPTVVGIGPGPTLSQSEEAVPIPIETNWVPGVMTQDRQTLAADTVHFAYDSAVMRDSEMTNIESVATALKSDPAAKLLVEGNCDERGTEEYNRALGERRALSSREELAALGIDPMRVCTISYGKDKPVDPGHDEAAWWKNRRDDFVLLLPKVEIETNFLSYDP